MYTIGIDVGGTNLKAGLVDENYRIVATSKMPLVWQSQEKLVSDSMPSMGKEETV